MGKFERTGYLDVRIILKCILKIWEGVDLNSVVL